MVIRVPGSSLTPRGKVTRKSLRDPSFGSTSAAATATCPVSTRASERTPQTFLPTSVEQILVQGVKTNCGWAWTGAGVPTGAGDWGEAGDGFLGWACWASAPAMKLTGESNAATA